MKLRQGWVARNCMRMVAVLGTGFGLAACGGSSLTGSMSEMFDLGFDTLAIYKQAPALLIVYKKDTDIVCKVVLDTTGLTLADNTTMSNADFVSHVSFSRAAKAGGSFGTPTGGELKFTHYSFDVGGHVSGSFDAVLDTGRTILGDFDGKVQDSGL